MYVFSNESSNQIWMTHCIIYIIKFLKIENRELYCYRCKILEHSKKGMSGNCSVCLENIPNVKDFGHYTNKFLST